MENFLFWLIECNGPIVLLLGIFFTGFLVKLLLYYVYDIEMENIMAMEDCLGRPGQTDREKYDRGMTVRENEQETVQETVQESVQETVQETTQKTGIVFRILQSYQMLKESGVEIRNTQVFVENRLNRWKNNGISVQRMERFGDICGDLCIVLCAFLDMVLLTGGESFSWKMASNLNLDSCAYVYTAIAVICYMTLRLWESFLNASYKRKCLVEAVTDYIDNLDGLSAVRKQPEEAKGSAVTRQPEEAKVSAVTRQPEEAKVSAVTRQPEEVNSASCEEVISPAKRYFDKVNSVLRKDKTDLMRKGVNEESNEEKEEVIKQVLDEFLA